MNDIFTRAVWCNTPKRYDFFGLTRLHMERGSSCRMSQWIWYFFANFQPCCCHSHVLPLFSSISVCCAVCFVIRLQPTYSWTVGQEVSGMTSKWSHILICAAVKCFIHSQSFFVFLLSIPFRSNFYTSPGPLYHYLPLYLLYYCSRSWIWVFSAFQSLISCCWLIIRGRLSYLIYHWIFNRILLLQN